MDTQLFHTAIHASCGVMRQVKADDMAKATPCTEWNVKALMDHMAYEAVWIVPMLQGKTIQEVGTSLDGDHFGADPMAGWQKLMEAAVAEAEKTPLDNTVHLSYADKSVAEYLNEVGADLIVHSWDLAKGIGAAFPIDDNTADAIMEHNGELVDSARGKMFADKVDVASDASKEEKLLAWYGRKLDWTASKA